MDEGSYRLHPNGIDSSVPEQNQNGTTSEVPPPTIDGTATNLNFEPVPIGFNEIELMSNPDSAPGKETEEDLSPDHTVPIGLYSSQTLSENGLEKTGINGSQRPLESHAQVTRNPVLRWRMATSAFLRRHRRQLRLFFLILMVVGYHAYLVAAIHRNRTLDPQPPFDFCHGVGLLVIITVVSYWSVFYYYLIKPNSAKLGRGLVNGYAVRAIRNVAKKRITGRIVALLVISGFLLFLVLDTAGDRYRLVSLVGLVVFLSLSWLFSKHPDKVIWRHVLWGLLIQFSFGLIVLKWEVGRSIFQCIGDKVKIFLDYTDFGSQFVFGFLVNGDHFVLATKVLPVIIFFSFIIQILYYYGVMCWILTRLGWLLQITIGTTACESLNAAANIFIGQTEAPLLVRPFLHLLTVSELHAVMTGGFATIAGSVMAAYIQFGVSASHLLSASVMAAPAALAVSKLFYPETERSCTTAGQIDIRMDDKVNVLDAASQGAMSVVKICGYIAASLIAFIAFIFMVNGILGWLGALVGWEVSFQLIASWVLRPLALLMGVPWEDCGRVAELLALKIVINEFVAYSTMRDMVAAGLLSQRAVTISTFALCGFANLSSIGIQISGISAMAPERKSDLARIAVSAMLAGNVASFLNACVAGLLIEGTSGGVVLLSPGNGTILTTTIATNLVNATSTLI